MKNFKIQKPAKKEEAATTQTKRMVPFEIIGTINEGMFGLATVEEVEYA